MSSYKCRLEFYKGISSFFFLFSKQQYNKNGIATPSEKTKAISMYIFYDLTDGTPHSSFGVF